MGVRATMYGSQKSHYPCLKRHEHEEKSDIVHVLRNYHKTITTQAILLSFFQSEDKVLSDEIKICYSFEYQGNENRAFRFFGGHPDANFLFALEKENTPCAHARGGKYRSRQILHVRMRVEVSLKRSHH